MKEEQSGLGLQKDLIIDFYPEGGTLVNGIESTLGIKIADTDGNEISTYGKIVDQNNNTIKKFKTYEFGLGKISYLPQAENKYFASVTINNEEKKYALPNPQDKGYLLNLVQTTEHITIKVSSTIENGLKESVLVGHTRGRVFLQHRKNVNASSYLLKIPIKDLEDGVAHFTLFTTNGEPVCERLVFINNPENDFVLNIETSSATYKKRQQVAVELILENTQGNKTSGNFSASVISNAVKEKVDESIESWLLLNSDIGGTIENASFFFEKDTAKKRYLLDALMLTHGWRRFVWNEMLNEKVSKNFLYEPEKGITVQGNTTSFKNKYQPKVSSVNFTIFGSKFFNEVKTTDLNGNFTFGPFFFQDSIRAIKQSESIKTSSLKSENEFTIQINEFSPIVHQNIFKNSNPTIEYKNPTGYRKIESQKKEILDFNLDSKTIILNEVTVSDNRKNPREILEKKINGITLHGNPYKRIFIDSLQVKSTSTIFDLMRHIPGVLVFGSPGLQGAKFRGSPVIYYVDGLEVSNVYVNFLSPSEVEFIDFLRDHANKFGYNIPDPDVNVMTIYTKKRLGKNITNQELMPNIRNITLKGFHKTREFYSPRYDVPKKEHKLRDFRTTLHWEPNIIVNKDGVATINFYTGDIPGKYLIHIEGITNGGIPVNTIQSFEVLE